MAAWKAASANVVAKVKGAVPWKERGAVVSHFFTPLSFRSPEAKTEKGPGVQEDPQVLLLKMCAPDGAFKGLGFIPVLVLTVWRAPVQRKVLGQEGERNRSSARTLSPHPVPATQAGRLRVVALELASTLLSSSQPTKEDIFSHCLSAKATNTRWCTRL